MTEWYVILLNYINRDNNYKVIVIIDKIIKTINIKSSPPPPKAGRQATKIVALLRIMISMYYSVHS